MKERLRHLIALAAVLLFAEAAQAQTGGSSTTADNTAVVVAPGTVELRTSESSYFGPDSHWEIHGTLEIWSKNIWIAPTATFTGTGRIIIHDPTTNPYYSDIEAGPRLIDAHNAAYIGVVIAQIRSSNV